jgi:hypothetical protein
MLNGWLILWSPRAGRAVGVSRLARCQPLRPEGRPRILRKLHKISGGAAVSA